MLSNPQNSTPGSDTSSQSGAVTGALASALAGRLDAVRRRMAAAAHSAGRDPRQVTLLAMTKGQDLSRIRAALALGLTEFGENYVGEALAKIHALQGTGASWHFTGRLQANKTRPVAEHFAWVHSIDRLRIAERLSAQRPFHAPPLNACVQVHIADDPEKGGVAPEEALALLRAMAALPRLRLRGLMCMLPYEAPVPEQHAAFARLARLADEARAAGLPLDTLSMGMSADLDAAIAEGATIVRVGTALFGPREP